MWPPKAEVVAEKEYASLGPLDIRVRRKEIERLVQQLRIVWPIRRVGPRTGYRQQRREKKGRKQSAHFHSCAACPDDTTTASPIPPSPIQFIWSRLPPARPKSATRHS